jgi:hypothetical protein
VVRGAQEGTANRPLIREQAFGESLDPDKLERLGRYEVHLDRKLERTLAMLLRLKDLRREATGLIRLAKQMVASCTSREDFSRPCGARGSPTVLLRPASRDPPIGFQLH